MHDIPVVCGRDIRRHVITLGNHKAKVRHSFANSHDLTRHFAVFPRVNRRFMDRCPGSDFRCPSVDNGGWSNALCPALWRLPVTLEITVFGVVKQGN